MYKKFQRPMKLFSRLSCHAQCNNSIARPVYSFTMTYAQRRDFEISGVSVYKLQTQTPLLSLLLLHKAQDIITEIFDRVTGSWNHGHTCNLNSVAKLVCMCVLYGYCGDVGFQCMYVLVVAKTAEQLNQYVF